MINYYLPIVQVCTNIQQHHHACTTSMSVCRKLHYFSQLNKPTYFIGGSTSKVANNVISNYEEPTYLLRVP